MPRNLKAVAEAFELLPICDTQKDDLKKTKYRAGDLAQW